MDIINPNKIQDLLYRYLSTIRGPILRYDKASTLLQIGFQFQSSCDHWATTEYLAFDTSITNLVAQNWPQWL
jgi:hypothetical protein